MRKLLIFTPLAVFAILTTSLVFAGAGKFELLGPNGNAWCDGSGVLAGEPGGYGFAVINASSDGKVMATVSLKKLEPNAEYLIRLIQGPHDCHTTDVTVTTNGKGNATVHYSEESVADFAFVFVEGGDQTYTHYVTETYYY